MPSAERLEFLRRRTARLRRLGLLAAGLVVLVMAGGSVSYLRESLAPERSLFKDLGQEYLLARALLLGWMSRQPERPGGTRWASSSAT